MSKDLEEYGIILRRGEGRADAAQTGEEKLKEDNTKEEERKRMGRRMYQCQGVAGGLLRGGVL